MTDTDGTDGVPPRRERPRRRRLWAIVAALGAVLVAGVVTLLVLWSRDSGDPVSMEEARGRADDAADAGDDAGDETVPLRPAAGVYRYLGEGTEQLDIPPVNQGQGPEIPGTVTHLDGGCWRFRVDYNTNHWQSWDYCPSDGGLVETAGEFFQRLDLVVTKVDTTSEYTCDPPVDAIRPGQRAGDEWMHECRGTSTGTEGEVVTSGPYTFVGPERLDIGGTPVAALHYHRLRNLTGGQSGTEDIHVWFDADTGLPLRNEREITVRSDSLIGGVTYEETGNFQIASTTPT